jgi:hypothetical protein
MAADLALARAGAAGEQRRAVQHDADAAAAILRGAHLRQQMQQEQQRAIRDARQAGAEATGMAHLLVLAADLLLDLLPLHAEGRVGQHVVELLRRVAVVGEGVAGDDVAHVLALDEHVCLADGVALVVQFLSVHRQACGGVMGQQVLACDGQHAARAGGRIIDGADGWRAGAQDVAVLDKEQVDHQLDDVARRKVLASGLVADLGELADQFLEGEPHVVVADGARAEIEGGEALGDLVEQPGPAQPVRLFGGAEAVEDVAHRGGEALDVGREIGADVILVAHDAEHVERRGVGEGYAGDAGKEGLGVEALGFAGGVLGQHLRLRRREYAVEASENREGQDHAAVLGRLIVAAEEIRDGPDQGREAGVAHGGGLIGS